MKRVKVKILIIRFSSIGDIVLTTPIIRCLYNQLGNNVEIHYLTKIQYVSLLSANPNVAKIHSIVKNTNEVIKDLKKENFGYIIDLHRNLRSKQVIRKLKTTTFTFHKLNIKKWLFTQFKINNLPDIHIVDRYFEAVKQLGINNDGLGLVYFIPNDDVVTRNLMPKTHQSEFIAFAIGGQFATKKLPTQKIIDICKQINQPIVLLGGNEDEIEGNKITAKTNELVWNACGKFSINQSASIVEQSKKLITHDTGLMHIGVALGIDIISVWGNTVPAFGMYPYYPNHPEKYKIIENKELSCRPCSKIGYQKCPKKHFKCMEDIDVKEIVRNVVEK